MAHLTGSFFTQYLDDAQLLLGTTLRDAARLPEAIEVFTQLPRLYPTSLLRDDALFELAVTHVRAGQLTLACASVAALAATFPRSKYLSPARRAQACPRQGAHP